ncbi:mucin-5AC-like [Portunus trituberculatus]|uniref:mucin-5AC-like n=1 Tax=Portunus trituberculatus TaxID=210409 RepID=UPI001E1CBA9B|nr:mucin-5AC-like [Portunus trituberculatus]
MTKPQPHPGSLSDTPVTVSTARKDLTAAAATSICPSARIVSLISKSSFDTATPPVTPEKDLVSPIWTPVSPKRTTHSPEKTPTVPRWSPDSPAKSSSSPDKVCGSPKWAPISPKKVPAAHHAPPVSTEQTSVTPGKEVNGFKVSTDEPVTTTEAGPVSTEEAIMPPQWAPVSTTKTPVTPKQAPVSPEKKSSVAPTWSPVSPVKSPVTPGWSSVSPEKSSVAPKWSPEKETAPRKWSPVSPEKRLLPVSPEKKWSPMSAEKRWSPVSPEKRWSPVSPEKRWSPVSPEKRFSPVSPEKRWSPMPPEKRWSPVYPERRLTPMSPEKRWSPLSPEKASDPPRWSPVSPEKGCGTPRCAPMSTSHSDSSNRGHTTTSRGYRDAAIREASASTTIHPDIAKHVPIITKVFPLSTTTQTSTTTTSTTTTTASSAIIERHSITATAMATSAPHFYIATTKYIPAVTSVDESSTEEDTFTTTTVTATHATTDDTDTATKDSPAITKSGSTFITSKNKPDTTTTTTALEDDLPSITASNFTTDATTKTVDFDATTGQATPATSATCSIKSVPVTTTSLHCATKYISAAGKSAAAPVSERFTAASASPLPRSSSQPDLKVTSVRRGGMCSPNDVFSASITTTVGPPWRAAAHTTIRVAAVPERGRPGRPGESRPEPRHHSVDSVSRRVFSVRGPAHRKAHPELAASGKRHRSVGDAGHDQEGDDGSHRLTASRPQPEGGPGGWQPVRCRSTITLNLQTESSSAVNAAPRPTPGSGAEKNKPQQSKERLQRSFSAESYTAVPNARATPRQPSYRPHSPESPTSPRVSPEGSHQGTTVLGTFNFHDRSRTPSLLARGEPPPSLSDGSPEEEESGATLLGTFNFLGSRHPAPPMASRLPPPDGVPSLTDSLISLEDGKHLLAVFDFTKPGMQRPPPPLAVRPPPAQLHRPQPTKTQKCTPTAAQNPAPVAPKKSVPASPTKRAATLSQRPATTSPQKPASVVSKKSPHSSPTKDTPASPRKTGPAPPMKPAPGSSQKSASVPAQQPAPPSKTPSAPASLKSDASPPHSSQKSSACTVTKQSVVATTVTRHTAPPSTVTKKSEPTSKVTKQSAPPTTVTKQTTLPSNVTKRSETTTTVNKQSAPASAVTSKTETTKTFTKQSEITSTNTKKSAPACTVTRQTPPASTVTRRTDTTTTFTKQSAQPSTVTRQALYTISDDDASRSHAARTSDVESSGRTPNGIVHPKTSQTTSRREQVTRYQSGEPSRSDDHFHSVELMCLEGKEKENQREEDDDSSPAPPAPLSKQSSVDSISQFLSRQFTDWDSCSPALSLIQSGDFWCTDRPLSPSTTLPHQGERVVEPYGGGVSAQHAHATTTAGGGRGAHVSGEAEAPQPIDPAILTSIDLENDHPRHEMPVTDTPQLHHNHHHRHHDLNHNDHVFVHKPPEEGRPVGGRAAKYVVHDDHPLGMGHDNYAFDSETSGQDIYSYDPGYSSERSPEDEERPPLFHAENRDSDAEEEDEEDEEDDEQLQSTNLRLHPGHCLSKEDLMKLLPFINEGTIFEVTVIKNLRGLGLAVCGGIESQGPYAGLIRIKKLYPQTPAWLCGQLEVGDVLLHANDNPLTGLSSHEALEMLRTTDREVTLEVCRPPPGTFTAGEDVSDGGSGVISTSLTLPSTSHNYLSPSPSFSSCGEFELTLTKVGGSLGFTLRKQDNSILGHTIRTLVREPALSDGRIRPGDKIISVNNTNMCNLSHEEAIAYLRTCPDTVTLKLYRDAMQTPVSPASPTEPDKILKPKPLRKEARDMLTDLAMRKQSPGNSLHMGGSTNSPGTPRRRRLQKTPSPDIKSVVADRWDSLVRESDETLLGSPSLEKKVSLNSISEIEHDVSPFGDSQTDDSASTTVRSRHSSAASSCSFTPSVSESRPKRPSFLDLNTGHSCPRKTQFTPPHEMDQSFPSPQGGHYPTGDSPDSAPPLTSAHSDTPAFSHLHQVYHSVNLGVQHPHEDLTMASAASHQNLSGLDGDGPTNQGLLKWKGVVFTPDSEDEDSSTPHSPTGSLSLQKQKLVTLELNRGWNSRLGFSLQQQGDQTVITAIYADSVAAKDGRLKIGDVVVEVNNTNVVGWDSESVIDMLRKTRGKIFLTVHQQPC